MSDSPTEDRLSEQVRTHVILFSPHTRAIEAATHGLCSHPVWGATPVLTTHPLPATGSKEAKEAPSHRFFSRRLWRTGASCWGSPDRILTPGRSTSTAGNGRIQRYLSSFCRCPCRRQILYSQDHKFARAALALYVSAARTLSPPLVQFLRMNRFWAFNVTCTA